MKDFKVTLLVDGYDRVKKQNAASALREVADTGENLFRQKDYGCLRDISWKIDKNGTDANTIWAYFRGKADLTVSAENKESASDKALREGKNMDFGELLMSAVTMDVLSIEEEKT